MKDALIALHFQNDTCHPDGRVSLSLNRGSDEAAAFLAGSRAALARARGDDWIIVHAHIAFAADYSDLPRNCRLFRAVAERGAVKLGSWGAQAFSGFEPKEGEIHLTKSRNSAFGATGLESKLRTLGVERVTVMGLATQFSVEHTVRDAADMGFHVTVISECCSSADPAAHRASLNVMAMLADIH